MTEYDLGNHCPPRNFNVTIPEATPSPPMNFTSATPLSFRTNTACVLGILAGTADAPRPWLWPCAVSALRLRRVERPRLPCGCEGWGACR
jgi:hypothetical protein